MPSRMLFMLVAGAVCGSVPASAQYIQPADFNDPWTSYSTAPPLPAPVSHVVENLPDWTNVPEACSDLTLEGNEVLVSSRQLPTTVRALTFRHGDATAQTEWLIGRDQFQVISHLTISANDIPPIAIANLAKVSGLLVLTLQASQQQSSVTLAPLGQCAALNQLSIRLFGHEDVNLSGMNRVATLTALRVMSNIQLDADFVVSLQDLRQLRALDVSGAMLSRDAWRKLKTIDALHYLSLPGAPSQEWTLVDYLDGRELRALLVGKGVLDIADLVSKAATLKYLATKDTLVTAKDNGPTDEVVTLEIYNGDFADVRADALLFLSRARLLRGLSLARARNVSERELCTLLGQCKALEYLDLSFVGVGGCLSVVTTIAKLRRLKEVGFGGVTTLSDEGLAVLASGIDYPIDALSIHSCSGLTKSGLAVLSGFGGIVSLDVLGVAAVDNDVVCKTLTSIISLEHLRLCNCHSIGAVALDNLLASTQLKTLDVTGCSSVKPDETKALALKYPTVEIAY